MQSVSIGQKELAIIDKQGLTALTMRKLGHRLGVEAMTLYHHIAGKDALLDRLVEQALPNAHDNSLKDDATRDNTKIFTRTQLVKIARW